jgi:hypothetical protein
MPIQYGELSIIYHQEDTVFTDLFNWMTNRSPNKSTHVFLFGDGEICEYTDKSTEVEFVFFGRDGFSTDLFEMPVYFYKRIQNVDYRNPSYFYKERSKNNDLAEFKPIFGDCSKYDESNVNAESMHNCCFYRCKDGTKPDVFGVVYLKSNRNMPRFQFAYDSDEFSKAEVVRLVYKIINR